jgi:hypothetical protein
MVPPLDETIIGHGEGRIAKNTGVVNRINSVQAARDNIPTLAATVAAIARSRGSGAEDAQGGGDCKCDESHLSTHGGFLLLPDATRIESRADWSPDKSPRIVNVRPLYPLAALSPYPPVVDTIVSLRTKSLGPFVRPRLFDFSRINSAPLHAGQALSL